MKTIPYISILMLGSILFIQACGGEDEPSAEAVFLQQLAGTWQIARADLDGKDVTNSFPGMLVTINEDKSFTVANAVPPMWKASNTFTLTGTATSFQINRGDGLTISVNQVTASRLILEFQYDADAMGGRTGSVTGQFTFEFDAN
jgi:hypothetical protein